MSVPHLSVVKIDDQSPAARARQLFEDARAAAFEQVTLLEDALDQVSQLAKSVADGGDIYPAGVREMCRRVADEAAARRQTLELLARRADQR